MAYQPIQMPGGLPSFGIADAVMEARRAQRQKQQDAWQQMYQMGEGQRAQQRIDLEKQRQQQLHEMEQARLDRENQDRQVDIQQKILALHDKGLSHEADQIAQMYGLHGQQQAPGMAKPQEPQPPPAPGPQPQPPEFVGPLETPDMARERGAEDHALGADFANEQTTAQAGDEAANEVQRQQAAREQYGQASRQFAAARMAQGAFPQQVLDYRDKQAAYDEAATHTPIAYSGKGMSFMVNPLERHQAQTAQNAERADTLLAALRGTPLEPYGGVAAAMAKSNLVDPKTIFADVDAMAKADAAAREKAKGEPAHSADRFEQEKKLAGIRASTAAAATAPAKADTGNRQDMSALRQAFESWKRTVQLNVDAKSMKRLQTITTNINSGNAMQQREAAESLVSVFRGGGQVTKASQDLLLNHLAGIVGDAQTWVQHHLTGHYGEQELGVLKQAAQAALAEEQEKAGIYNQSAVDTFGPGSGWENLGANVNHMVRGALRQFGHEFPDVYGSAPPPVTLGSGTRPGHQPKKSKNETRAAAVQATGEDRDALEYYNAQKASGQPVPPNVENELRRKGLIE